MRHSYLTAGAWNGSVTVTDRAGNQTTRMFTVIVQPLTSTPPSAGTPTPTPADGTPPQLPVKTVARQPVRTQNGVRVTVRCSERCVVRARAALGIRKQRYALRPSNGTSPRAPRVCFDSR